ncbi:MAG: Gfo/Idh/MocA family oxidoreductase [Victivallaceae bacterium]|jgi:predicted dehydrogenase
MTEKPLVGLVGCGHRLTGLAGYLKDKVQIRAICEPDSKCADNFRKLIPGDYSVTSGYDEFLEQGGMDWVMVGSPNNMHKEHIVKAFEAGLNVFAEKPLATTIDDCVAVCDAHRRSGKQFATGFVLRFSPHYLKIKELLDSGAVGDIISFEFDECIPHYHGGHIMKGWRRFKEISGGHIVEKCCHDIDLANWFTGSTAGRAASFGGLNFFKPENAGIIDEIGPDSGGCKAYSEWQHVTTQDTCPFNSGKTIIDNQVAIIEYRNGVRATFHANLNTGLKKRGFYICGTRGTLESEWYSGRILLQKIGHGLPVEDFSTPAVTGSHGGADEIIMDSLYETMTTGKKPLCGGLEGLLSTVTAIAIQQAMEKGEIINLNDIWRKLNIR